MNCVKCGAELRSDQKVCIVCGTRTVAGGNFDVEEKQAWKPTRSMIYAAAGVALVLIIALVAMCLKTVPPDVVTKEWFDAMSQRECRKAEQLNSPEFVSKMQAGTSDTAALSDYLFDEVNGKQGKYAVGAPTYDIPSAPTRAQLTVTISYPEGPPRMIPVDLVKSGRRWLIANVAY